MSDFSNVTVSGRLTMDIESSFTTNGTQVGKFGLATSKGFGDNKKTIFVDVTIWGKQADFASKYFKKGDSCVIIGHLDFDQWQTKEGEKRSKLYITADKVLFGDKRKEEGEEPNGKVVDKNVNQPADEEKLPF